MKGEERLVEEGKGKEPTEECLCVCVQDSLGDSLQGTRKQREV